jgi:hypothetical protein
MPTLGLEVLAVTMACFGPEFAALRFAAALLLPLIIALVVAALPGARPAVVTPADEAAAAPGRSLPGWLDHVSIAFAFGMVAAGVFEQSIAPRALLDHSASPLELAVVTLLALLSGVPALGLVLPLWVLVGNGLSPGAAMIALLIAPLFGRGGLQALYSQLGVVKTVVAVGWAVAIAWVVGYLQNRPGLLSRLSDGREVLHPVFAVASQVALAALLLLAVWRMVAVGARLWLSALATRS